MRYCITLDSDTRLPRDAAREADRHHRAPAEPAVVRSRRSAASPTATASCSRASASPITSAAGSLFARLFSGHTGVDPYTTAVSDTYQDLFGEGIFTGKGLYDVDAFMASLEGRVPENALLSHDLFEACTRASALVSDIELVDEYPSSVLAHAAASTAGSAATGRSCAGCSRSCRRGTACKRNTLPLIARWKILDNLRRSLVAPTLLALLVAGWTVLPGARWFWMMTVLRVMALAAPAAGRAAARRAAPGAIVPVFWRNLREDTVTALAQVALSLTFLAYHAWETAHAIVLTLVRLVVTRRRLLEWETRRDRGGARRGSPAAARCCDSSRR